ncbi:hypothetical protein GCM10009678_66550 [Actinomadura kijaniata]|uniref:ATP-binding protein n=1 Tax=Actinomadura namibiensis TaxID=182080 RepID=A0A7W3LYD9_ACTNM|nr:ATP-binding protein [Actinomadura namibiensis]MBA8956556.1 hypothetical protein [Actinomadura namibiensis]
MLNNNFPLAAGGFHAFSLPDTPECASIARSALTIVMSQLTLPRPLIEDGALAVSELASNSLLHAPRGPYELWIWRRTVPEPQLVVSVFDTDRTHLPTFTPGDLLAENGRGLTIVTAFSADTGTHPTRSRLQPHPIPGKAVWFALTLKDCSPFPSPVLTPLRAAQQLLLALTVRGLHPIHITDLDGPTVIALNELRIQVTCTHYLWGSPTNKVLRLPLTDLQDVVEALIQQVC